MHITVVYTVDGVSCAASHTDPLPARQTVGDIERYDNMELDFITVQFDGEAKPHKITPDQLRGLNISLGRYAL